MSDFVTFDLAKKLKEKGFTCKYPFAMYNEDGDFCALYTSADILEVDSDGLQTRDYYCFVDFDWYDCIAPTISQVLKWLREGKNLFIEVSVNNHTGFDFYFIIYEKDEEAWLVCGFNEDWYDTYEEAALAGIKYCLDNLI